MSSVVNSGIRADDREDFIWYIKAEIQRLADEIADLAMADDSTDRIEADRLIAIHRRTIGRLRVHLPSIPTGS